MSTLVTHSVNFQSQYCNHSTYFHIRHPGISTGTFELRADGTFHEWTIFNQHPAGAAKIQLIDDVFMGVRAAVPGRQPVSVVLQTHPSDPRLPGVQALKYHGKEVELLEPMSFGQVCRVIELHVQCKL